MRILNLHPDFEDPGGISNYYLKLKDKFTVSVEHFSCGKRPTEKGKWALLRRMIGDYVRFIKLLKNNRYDIVHLNPSLSFKCFTREGIFHLLAGLFHKKTIVFWRGWNLPFQAKITRNGLWLFKYVFKHSSAFIVLGEYVEQELRTWGFTQPIYREVTVIDDLALRSFDIKATLAEREKSKKIRILFLARIIKAKGIYETLQAYHLLKTNFPQLELVVVGDGPELENVKIFAGELNISDIEFTGYISGEAKFELYKKSHIFCFPSYEEGFPNSVVEAMAFGLPVVTRTVGGLPDFFRNEHHGFITDSKKPEVLAKFIERLIVDEKLRKEISTNNYRHAQENFLASKAAARLEKIYEAVINDVNGQADLNITELRAPVAS